jgi:uncharacterized delta-60 repeat protein
MIRKHLGRLALLTSLAFLCACGGSDGGVQGGDNNPPPPPPPPPPVAAFSLALSIDKAVITQGGSVPVTVTVTREAGFTGAVTLAASALPNGVTTPAVVVAADATSVVMPLAAAPEAPHSLPTVTEIKGTAGELAKTASLTVTVRGKPGAIDTSFAAGKLIDAFSDRDDYVEAMALQADGRLVVAGHTTVTGSGTDFAVVRYLRDGGLDTSFGTGGRLTTAIAAGTRTDDARAVALDAQGKILVAGTSDGGATGQDFALVRYNADGSLDAGFGDGGKVVTSFGNDADHALAILVQLDGKIVLGGESYQGTATGQDFALVRYNNDGSLDTSFGNGGKVLTAISGFGGKDSIHALARQVVNGQERIVAVGGESGFVMARYHADGTLDAGFGNGGTIANLLGSTVGAANAVVVDDAGKLVIAGHSQQNFALVRLNVDGSFDTTFGIGGRVVHQVSVNDWDQATSVALQNDGKVVVGGWAFLPETGPRFSNFVLQRYDANGALDDSFGHAGTVITNASPRGRNNAGRAMLLQADTRVATVRAIQAGEAVDAANDFAVVRYWL